MTALSTVAARLFLINSIMKKLLKSSTHMSMKLYSVPFLDLFPALLKIVMSCRSTCQ